jgi:ATP-dependent DNA helicase RecG
MSESNRIEYKRELSEGLEKEVIAYLNYREGGFIFIGIEKNRDIVGLSDADGDQLKIKDRLKNNIAPSCMGLFDVVLEQKEGKEVIKITVASGSEKPYYLKKQGMTEKGCFIRLGSAAEPMPQKLIDELFAKRTRNSISKIKSNRQDLVFEQLKIYYEAKGLKLNDKFATNLELLNADGVFNYVAYLLADSNGTSIKVAKYKGNTRVDLIENNEYGYCSLIKATKQVLDKLELENKTFATITSKERINKRLWNAVALREAVINAIVHNDYTHEIPPKFEIFADRIEITSAGSLPDSISQDEFFEGISVPRNKELMRVFKDLDLVEQLGSGIPRIIETYGRECVNFTTNFVRMTFMAAANVHEVRKVGDNAGGTIGGTKI